MNYDDIKLSLKKCNMQFKFKCRLRAYQILIFLYKIPLKP